MADFKERLRCLRIEKAVTQKEIGKVINVSDAAIRFYEAGKREPTIKGLIALSEFFGVSIDYLVGADDVPNRRK